MERWTYDELHELYESRGRPTYEAFANWLHVSVRSIARWLTKPAERPNMEMTRHIDAQVRAEVRRRHPRLPASQVEYMDRRGLLKLLSMGVAAPIGGMSMVWSASPTHVSAAMLDGLEDTTTALASSYGRVPPHALLGAVMGHLEEISALLRGAAMQPSQRVRLDAIAADVAVFVGSLSMQAGRFTLADAHFGLAERLAREAGDKALVAQTLVRQAMLHYISLPPGQADDDPRPQITLLEEAETLARHAAPIVAMVISGRVAEVHAAVGDAYGADAAIERSLRALDRVRMGDATKGFCSTAGSYSGHNEAKLLGFRGYVELSLGRDSAVDTLRASLSNRPTHTECLADLAIALISRGQPEEACACLRTAHRKAVGRGSSIAMHHVLRARALMPPQWSSLRCVRELDEQLASLTD